MRNFSIMSFAALAAGALLASYIESMIKNILEKQGKKARRTILAQLDEATYLFQKRLHNSYS